MMSGLFDDLFIFRLGVLFLFLALGRQVVLQRER